MAEGYDGPIYMEIAPQTFSVLVRTGTRLNQLRLKRGAPPLLSVKSVGVDLTDGVAGFRARRHAGVIDLDKEDGHDPRDFWEPLEPRRGELLLDPGRVLHPGLQGGDRDPGAAGRRDDPHRPVGGRVPRPLRRLLRSRLRHRRGHGRGSRGVLEVRSHETPFLLEDGQTVARLVYEPLTERPDRLYGEGGSHYQRQGLKLGVDHPVQHEPPPPQVPRRCRPAMAVSGRS